MRVVGVEAVDVRPEAAAQPAKRGTCQRSAKSSSISSWSLRVVARAGSSPERVPAAASVRSAWRRWTRFVLRHRRARPRASGSSSSSPAASRARSSPPLLSNTFSVPGTDSERVRARPRAALRRPPRRLVHRRLPALGRARRPPSSRASQRGGRPRRARRPDRQRRPQLARRRARTSSTATSSRRSNLAQAKGYTDAAAARARHAAGRRARLRHRRGADPARPRPDLQPGPEEGRVRSRSRSRCSCCSPSSGSRAR